MRGNTVFICDHWHSEILLSTLPVYKWHNRAKLQHPDHFQLLFHPNRPGRNLVLAFPSHLNINSWTKEKMLCAWHVETKRPRQVKPSQTRPSQWRHFDQQRAVPRWWLPCNGPTTTLRAFGGQGSIPNWRFWGVVHHYIPEEQDLPKSQVNIVWRQVAAQREPSWRPDQLFSREMEHCIRPMLTGS